MNFFSNKTQIQTKHFYVGICVALFFIVQFFIVWYARYVFVTTASISSTATTEVGTPNATARQLSQIEQRLFVIQSDLVQVKSYLLTNTN